ncbi:MAG: DUF3322 domain-containing protein [Pirellulales bacterium]
MKSPADLRYVLRRQWESPAHREARLLGLDGAWPIVLSIGKPSSRLLRSDLDGVRQHVEAWRRMKLGDVHWEDVRYRDAAGEVRIPVQWTLRRPSEWVEAIADPQVRREFESLGELARDSPAMFHSSFIRKRSLWANKPLPEVRQAAKLAAALTPGCAQGRPLRSLSLEGIDTKFFERNAGLVSALLDVRFDGEVSRLGLERFLDALCDTDHWLLVVDLDGRLLPFEKLRLRSGELRERPLPTEKLLIVENESCQHLLPRVPGVIAVLGAGLDLHWTTAPWLATRQVGYWGDIDTWGLQCLSTARAALGRIESLLMSEDIFDAHRQHAVPEPVVAGMDVPSNLHESEAQLYRRLLRESHGRLEQEFLPASLVHHHLERWSRT